jgi:hypothetical protein
MTDIRTDMAAPRTRLFVAKSPGTSPSQPSGVSPEPKKYEMLSLAKAPASMPDGEASPAPPQRRCLVPREWARVALVALLALLITVAYRCVGGIQVTSTATPYVEVEEADISTDVRSIVTDNRVTGTPPVSTEKVLCRLDPGEFDIAIEKATVDLAETALTVRSMYPEARAC